MDAKYLAEIKAREQASTPGTWSVGDGTHQSLFNGRNVVIAQDGHYVVTERAVYPDAPDFNEQVFSDMSFIAAARTDIPALIAEVERLTDIEKEYLHYGRLSEEADQQIATLKAELQDSHQDHIDDFMRLRTEIAILENALELACVEQSFRSCPCSEVDGCDTCPDEKQGDSEGATEEKRASCWKKYYIQQAQEQEGKK